MGAHPAAAAAAARPSLLGGLPSIPEEGSPYSPHPILRLCNEVLSLSLSLSPSLYSYPFSGEKETWRITKEGGEKEGHL